MSMKLLATKDLLRRTIIIIRDNSCDHIPVVASTKFRTFI